MSKRIDITDKLELYGNPVLVIGDKEIEVNADAPTILRVMGMVDDLDTGNIASINQAYELMFPEASRKLIDDMKLSFSDWMTVIHESISLITGNDTPGEA